MTNHHSNRPSDKSMTVNQQPQRRAKVGNAKVTDLTPQRDPHGGWLGIGYNAAEGRVYAAKLRDSAPTA